MADDIGQAAPPEAVVWQQQRRQDPRDGRKQGRTAFARAAEVYERYGADPGEPSDSVSVQGIPPEELTPAVRRALSRLISEVDRLRRALAERAPSGLVAPHPFEADQGDDARPESRAGLLDPAALEETLHARLAAMTSGKTGLAVAFLYMANYEDVRVRHGIAAAEAARRAMVDALADARDEPEAMGSTGGASVVVLVPFDGDVEHLWARARALGRAAEVHLAWQGGMVPVHPLIGVHVVRRGENPADILWQAERAARRIG
ncbi:hypothetical protein [uncultured Rhodospira sp.]|uniref:hypothetical protein n=1 Tax=uncultured Rhodospira sp. TaxID=1936189 RepID=UPI00261BD0C5|nr:hypothetical protein [uncultured Rhodospira sp.]